MDNIETGVISAWIDTRAFGFITPDFGGPDLFAHITNFAEYATPAVGDRVQFLVTPGRDGRPAAKDVRTIERVEATA